MDEKRERIRIDNVVAMNEPRLPKTGQAVANELTCLPQSEHGIRAIWNAIGLPIIILLLLLIAFCHCGLKYKKS
jgi:hypothetical protein